MTYVGLMARISMYDNDRFMTMLYVWTKPPLPGNAGDCSYAPEQRSLQYSGATHLTRRLQSAQVPHASS